MAKHRRKHHRSGAIGPFLRWRSAVRGLPSSAKKIVVAAAKKIVALPGKLSPRQVVDRSGTIIRGVAKKLGVSNERAGTLVDYVADALYANMRRDEENYINRHGGG